MCLNTALQKQQNINTLRVQSVWEELNPTFSSSSLQKTAAVIYAFVFLLTILMQLVLFLVCSLHFKLPCGGKLVTTE